MSVTRRRHAGFTLIELLVVIAIIGILSTLAVVALNSARQRSRDAKRVSDVRQIQTALELSYSEVSSYPATPAAATPFAAGVLGQATTKVLCNEGGTPKFRADSTTSPACSTVYMGLVPANPLPNGTDYVYTQTGTGYSIGFTLEGATGQLSTGANCANGNGITSGALTC